MESKVKYFDGNGDFRVCQEMVSLHSALKEYDGEKQPQFTPVNTGVVPLGTVPGP